VRLKLSMSLRVIHMSVHAFGVHKLERRPTQSNCDYARRFTSSFSGTLMSLLLSLLKLKTCLWHANETYGFTYVCVCVCVCECVIFSARKRISRISLSLTCCFSRFRTVSRIRTRVCTHVHTKVRRVDYRLRFRVDYTLRYTLSFQPISRPVPFAPDSPVEIKEDLEMRVFAE